MTSGAGANHRAAPLAWPARELAAAMVGPILLLAAQAAAAQPASAASVGAAEAGRRLYVNSCARCHGLNLVSNGIGLDLRTFPQHDKERFVRSVQQGKGAMPAFGSALKPEQVDLIWDYVGSVNAWK